MKPWVSGWMRTADDMNPSVAPEPAPTPETKPLSDVDKLRAPAPANPTGQPDQKPMPLSELMRSIEAAGKAAIDAGLQLEKAAASLRKIQTMGGATPGERELMAKAEAMAKRAASLKQESDKLADEMADFRKTLSGGTPGAEGWTQ